MLIQLFLLTIYILMSAFGMLFIKLGSTHTHILFHNQAFLININLKFFLGLVLYAGSFLMYTVVLAKFDLSFVQPVAAGICMVLAVIFGVFFLQEKLTVYNIIGIIMIIAGVVLIGWNTGHTV